VLTGNIALESMGFKTLGLLVAVKIPGEADEAIYWVLKPTG